MRVAKCRTVSPKQLAVQPAHENLLTMRACRSQGLGPLTLKRLPILNELKTNYSVKDPIPSNLRAWVAYKFSCFGCTASYVGEKVRHLATRVN